MASADGDRFKDLKAFDDTKAGVKGLVDAGIVCLPKIFIQPPEELIQGLNNCHLEVQLPIIDLSEIKSEDKSKSVIARLKQAAEEWGFFQVTSHGIPQNVLDRTIEGIRKFHEQDAELKYQYYSRDQSRKLTYYSNVDLYQSNAAHWKDTLTIGFTDSKQAETGEMPEVCRSEITDYVNHVTKLGETLFELLSQALGLKVDNLNAMGCGKSQNFAMHYYPPCPEPDKTLGNIRHTDPSFLTILLQDHIGGLQVLHDNQWIDVPPIRGGLVVNIGDLLQIVSNDKFKSAEHRVRAKNIGPRISVACFLTDASIPAKKYGPLKELISEESPKVYKEFTVSEYIESYFSTSLDKSGLDTWKI